jgi:two-component system sensor histidine kinase RegB
MQQDYRDNPTLSADLQLMADQVGRCRQSLSQLSDTARRHQDGSVSQQRVSRLVDRLIRDWQVLRPDVAAEFVVRGGPELDAQWPLTVEQAMINVLNNAADAANTLSVLIYWTDRELVIEIEDDGPGISAQTLAQRGKVKPSEKGMGLGLLLSHASLERVGGMLSLKPLAAGGTLTRIVLPLGDGA